MSFVRQSGTQQHAANRAREIHTAFSNRGQSKNGNRKERLRIEWYAKNPKRAAAYIAEQAKNSKPSFLAKILKAMGR